MKPFPSNQAEQVKKDVNGGIKRDDQSASEPIEAINPKSINYS